MKLQTIEKYVNIMDKMLESDCLSVSDFCKSNDINYGTFKVQICKMKKVSDDYKEAIDLALEKYDLVLKKFHTSELYNSNDSYDDFLKKQRKSIEEYESQLSKDLDNYFNEAPYTEEELDCQIDNYFDNIKLLND